MPQIHLCPFRSQQEHLSPFRLQQEMVVPTRGERSVIEINRKGEDINAKVTIKSPPTMFDPSDLRGWD